MKKILIVALLLVGCEYNLKPEVIDKIQRVCEANGGMKETVVAGYLTVKCANGAVFHIDR